MRTFDQKVVWITGASSGIGKEAAIQFSKLGGRLVLSARRQEALQEVAKLCSYSSDILILPYDVTDTDIAKSMVNKVLEKFGRIDLLFQSAGISQRSYALDTEFSVYRKIMEVNYFGLVALSQAVLPHMVAAGGGHLLTISSVVGKFGFSARSAYSASKHALHGYMESVYLELKDQGIRTTLVCAGPVNTPLSISALDANGHPTGVMDEMQVKGMSPQKCVADILRAIQRDKREVVVGGFAEKLGVKIHGWFPALFLKLASKQDPRGEIKL